MVPPVKAAAGAEQSSAGRGAGAGGAGAGGAGAARLPVSIPGAAPALGAIPPPPEEAPPPGLGGAIGRLPAFWPSFVGVGLLGGDPLAPVPLVAIGELVPAGAPSPAEGLSVSSGSIAE